MDGILVASLSVRHRNLNEAVGPDQPLPDEARPAPGSKQLKLLEAPRLTTVEMAPTIGCPRRGAHSHGSETQPR